MRTSDSRTTRINQRLQRLARDQRRTVSALAGSNDKNQDFLQLRSNRLSRSIGVLQSMLDKENHE